MAQFFIDRPIFAWVVGMIVMLAGALSILGLPVSQYPAIAPPTTPSMFQSAGAPWAHSNTPLTSRAAP